MTLTEAQKVFHERLQAFVLFHLGTDAEVRFEADDGGSVEVGIRHPRVRDFSFSLNRGDLRKLLRDPEGTEEFLLDQLTSHRRGGLARGK